MSRGFRRRGVAVASRPLRSASGRSATDPVVAVQTGCEKLSTSSITLSKLSVPTPRVSSWTPPSTLTATEVIDRVREARTDEQKRAVEQLHLAVQWALLHPCRDEYPAGWEDDHGLFTAGAPLAGPGAPLVDEFAPASLAAALGITLEAAKQLLADALELTYRLPRLLDLVERGAVPVWRARAISRETHDLSARGRRATRTGSSRHTGEDRPGRRRPAGPGSPALLRPRPRHRRRGTRTHPTRRLATAPRQPRHHRRRDDPGHPRRPALRPDRRPHRRRTRRSSVTPTRSTSAGHGRSGSSPTPSTPWTSCPAAKRRTHRGCRVR